MYLKSIEIQGFKSFAYKTLLQFNEGVTAIVGPNGSGKSNIADAVRWVLGEQKVRQLRGTAMQDVIFAGTALKKAQGFAYVAITIDNADGILPVDYAEVTVSRRLFRSGESEYMINGQNVRLKDVQGLFFDTGIGKEGYSIIGQGQIDAILNGRPEDRRGLFDEAAGIVKFKHTKTESLRKLARVKENLQRITDILEEMEHRLKPLEKQSATAKTYLTLRDEQKKLDLNLFIRETRGLLESLRQADNAIGIANASLEEANEENNALREKSTELADSLSALEETVNQKREQSSKAELLIQNLENQIRMSEAEISGQEQNRKRDQGQMERLQKEAGENTRNILSYLESLDELQQSLLAIGAADLETAGVSEEEYTEILDKTGIFRGMLLDFAEIRELYEAKQSRAGNTTGDDHDASGEETGDANLKNVSETAKAALSAGRAEHGSIEDLSEEKDDEEDEDFSFQLPSWMESIRHKQDDLGRIREKEQKNASWLSQATEEYNRLTAELKEQQNRINALHQEEAAEQARYDQVKNLAERYQGFGESIRALMRESRRIGGIYGVVADLIHTKKEYETAVETALGGRIQNVVTENQQSAKDCIAFLKRTRQGRATFLPLDALRFKEQAEYRQAARELGAVGICSELVEADVQYQHLVRYLLANVLVVDHLDHALQIANKYRQSLRIVTLDGELLAPGGSIAGGSFKSNSNLIGRSRELAEMESRLLALHSKVETLLDQSHQKERLIREKGQEIDDLNQRMREITEEKNALSYGIMSDMRTRYTQLKEKTLFLKENVERICMARRNAEWDRAELSDRIQEAGERIREALDAIEARREDIRHLTEGKKQLDQEIADGIREKERLAGSQNDYLKRRDELGSEILTLEKELLRLESQREKEQQKLDQQTDYIWGEYELSFSQAEAFYEEELGAASKIKGRLSQVKSEIRALGPVNVQAIEEYKEVSERYEFLHAQQQDLVQSEGDILSIVKELDDGMKKQFDREFARIREQFTKVFRELFGGGEADLSLVYDAETDAENGKDELEAGIAIHVQPPGKKLQNIMQLSGGEKALTAIALLFAIQNLKPSPFCLLDEIEAALDDSNVSRFANYLHKLTDQTQFIVITHRRGTMESADRLYGVTMQEKGITKLVSVDLVSAELN